MQCNRAFMDAQGVGMDETFGAALLRLKEQLRVHNDKEVAEALGMTPTAFNSRKGRGSFPEDKLLALKARRPELGLDIDYVLTGRRRAMPPSSQPAPQPQHQVAEGWRGAFAPPINVALMSACIQLVADEVASRNLNLDHKAVTTVASSFYEIARAGGSPNPRLAAAMIDLYLAARGQ